MSTAGNSAATPPSTVVPKTSSSSTGGTPSPQSGVVPPLGASPSALATAKPTTTTPNPATPSPPNSQSEGGMEFPQTPDCKVYSNSPSTSTNVPSSTSSNAPSPPGPPPSNCGNTIVVQCPVQVNSCVFTVSSVSAQVWNDTMGATSTHVKLCYNASNKTSLTLPCVKSVAEPFTTAASTTAPTSAAVANGSSSVGVILGGVVGGLVALGLALFFFRRRRAAASSSQRQCDVSAYIPPQPTAARSATAPSPTPRAPPSAELDYTNVRHLRQYLSTHPKLESMWMADVVSPIKTTALKGAESTHVTTMVGTKKVVLKGMPYMDVSPQIRQAFVEGLLTLHGKSLRHRHLTTLLGMTLVDSNGHTLLCGATEYMDHGSIGAVLLDAKTQLDPHQQTTIAIAIAEAIEFLHRQHGLAFGLVAPDKILVDGSLHTVKLNVLTLLVPFYDGIRTTNLLSNAGSTLHIPFVAPELRRRDTSPTAASDVYALAVMIGFIFTRKLPFSTVYHDKGLVRGDLHLVQHPKTMPYAAEVIPESFRALWKSALDVDPARRPTASHLLLALNELPH